MGARVLVHRLALESRNATPHPSVGASHRAIHDSSPVSLSDGAGKVEAARRSVGAKRCEQRSLVLAPRQLYTSFARVKKADEGNGD